MFEVILVIHVLEVLLRVGYSGEGSLTTKFIASLATLKAGAPYSRFQMSFDTHGTHMLVKCLLRHYVYLAYKRDTL